MSFDLHALRTAVAAHGRVARVVVIQTRGSVPREAGTAMLVWDNGQDGTVGGGALEWEAAASAREALPKGGSGTLRHALGPDLGQCCGGAVTLGWEVYDTQALSALDANANHWLRPLGDAPTTIKVERLRTGLRRGSKPRFFKFVDGWLCESLVKPETALWIYGAGHVGRALVATLAPLPDWDITWIDTAADRFPKSTGVTTRAAADPVQLVSDAPPDAHHLILTYSHALDLALCHGILQHGFASAGVIGSATKWARFRKRLVALGHNPSSVDRIDCPIGDPALGKHPQAIAVGVAASLLTAPQTTTTWRDRA